MPRRNRNAGPAPTDTSRVGSQWTERLLMDLRHTWARRIPRPSVANRMDQNRGISSPKVQRSTGSVASLVFGRAARLA
jgi:hypothetical protein